MMAKSESEIEDLLSDVDVNRLLDRHTRDLAPAELITVTDGVYSAFGYGIANTICFEGRNKLVIIDTMDTIYGGELCLAAIREVTNKPIDTIVYTHHHSDHIGGTEAFVLDQSNPPDIWAHWKHPEEIQTFAAVKDVAGFRGLYQFGPHLGDAMINCGLGIDLHSLDADKPTGIVAPNKFVQQNRQAETIAGLDLEFVHIPGETNDHIGVWWPEKKVFACGDDLYKSFPNLYTIRGAVARSAPDWVESLETMLSLGIEHLVPSHTRPISGRQNVADILTAYRDAILHVHDETVRLMNQRMHPDEIADTVKLPPRLAKHPYLIEYYGTVKWSVKAIFTYYMGWFSGDPMELFPLTPSQRARKIVTAVGGVAQAVEKAQRALDCGENQWALELATYALKINNSNTQAFNIRTSALKYLGGVQVSANGRHWYLSATVEDHGLMPDPPSQSKA